MSFATPLLLLGLLAVGIPPLLHLLARVRAKDQPFPTLRFLRITVEKTARRRNLQNWLLLIVRCLLLAVLALAVAEPIVRAGGAWLGTRETDVVIVLDTSYSMNTRSGNPQAQDRFGLMTMQVRELLSGADQPGRAALLRTSAGNKDATLTTRLDELRRELDAAKTTAGKPDLAAAVRQAGALLGNSSNPNRAVYLFTDLQRRSVEPFLSGPIDLSGASLFVVHPPARPVRNVGVVDLRIEGPAVAEAEMTFLATVRNASQSPATVEVELHTVGPEASEPQRVVCSLQPAGRDDSQAEVRFTRRFSRAGTVIGWVGLAGDDDLPTDDRRYFALPLRGPVRALVIAGPAGASGGLAADPGGMLRVALDWRGQTRPEEPWPIRERLVRAEAFALADLHDADIAFFCDVGRFTSASLRAVRRFVRDGGTVWFFLGPGVSPESCNRWFFSSAGDGLLPGRLAAAVGQVGGLARAEALGAVDVEHPLLAGLYDNPADYRVVQTQRHVPMDLPPDRGRVLLGLAGGDPLLVEHRLGAGRVYWCTTTASSRWSDLPASPLFLPMVVRSALRSGVATTGGVSVLAGEPAEFTPPRDPNDIVVRTEVTLTPPDGPARRLRINPDGKVRATATGSPGVYRWTVDGTEVSGAFAANPYGPEGELGGYAAAEFSAELAARGVRAFAGTTLATARAGAVEASAGRNYWDLALAVAIGLLVFEGLLANRRRVLAGAVQNDSHSGPGGV